VYLRPCNRGFSRASTRRESLDPAEDGEFLGGRQTLGALASEPLNLGGGKNSADRRIGRRQPAGVRELNHPPVTQI